MATRPAKTPLLAYSSLIEALPPVALACSDSRTEPKERVPTAPHAAEI